MENKNEFKKFQLLQKKLKKKKIKKKLCKNEF